MSAAVELLYQAAIAHAASRVLIINAHAHHLLPLLREQCQLLDVQQHFKPEHALIQHSGLPASTVIPADAKHYDRILVLPSKNKQQTLGWMAEAMHRLEEHGTIMLACANRHGAKSYESALQTLAGNIRSRSKSKCRVFSARKTNALDSVLSQQWISSAQQNHNTKHGLISQPGLFSWDRADTGSQLLIDHLPNTLSGTGMDLCCGYGFLSEHLLRTSPDINLLHLLEADALALACAARNTTTWPHKTRQHWLDASCDQLPAKLDWIVCNPPFHSGQTRDVELGQRIVQRACQALRQGGVLYVVANRQLPYEACMRSELQSCTTLVEANGFKIIQGVR